MSSSSTFETRSRRNHHRRRNTIKDGKVVAKFYNPVSGRPYRPIGSLEQAITVQLTAFFPAFLAGSLSVNTYFARKFALSDFGGYNQYVTVFDQYKIMELEVWIEPNNPTSAGLGYPELATCVDLDDSATPTTLNMVGDHCGALVAPGCQGRYHKWIPHIALASYAGAFTSYANSQSIYIDSGSTGVEHYAIKVAQGVYTSAAQSLNMSVRAKISFRAPGIN